MLTVTSSRIQVADYELRNKSWPRTKAAGTAVARSRTAHMAAMHSDEGEITFSC